MARMQKLEADGPACTPWSGPSGVSLVTSQCPQPRAARDDTSQEEHLFNIPGPVLPLGSPMASSYSLTNSRCPDLIPDHSPQTLPSQKNQLVKRCRGHQAKGILEPSFQGEQGSWWNEIPIQALFTTDKLTKEEGKSPSFPGNRDASGVSFGQGRQHMADPSV